MPTCPVLMRVNTIQQDIPAGISHLWCFKLHMKYHIPIYNISPANNIPICTQKICSIGCVNPNMCNSLCQCLHWTWKCLSFQLSMVHTCSLEQVFMFFNANFCRHCWQQILFFFHWEGEGKGNHKFCSVWKFWRHSLKIVEISVFGPVALVQYIHQHAKDNKMQAFPSLPPPAAVERFISYVPICIDSP